MTNKEYLESLKSNAQIGINRGPGLFSKQDVRNAAIVIVCAIVVTTLAALVSSMGRDRDYDDLKNGKQVVFQSLNYKDSFKIWNNRDNGNDINAILTGGRILAKDGVLASGLSEKDKELGFNYIGNVSYINKYDQSLVFRDNKDRHIYLLNLKDNSKKLIYEGNCGQILCVNSKIYFIDFRESGKVACIDLKDEKLKKSIAIDSKVRSFVVCGDTVAYLNSEHELYFGNMNTKNHTKLASMVERFYINGDIIAESGDRIIAFTPSGKNARNLYKSPNEDMRLAGVVEDRFIVLEKKALSEIVNGKKNALSDFNAKYINSITKVENSIYAGVYFAQDGKLIPQILKISK